MKHLLVTNDFPPKLGGIQSYLWELWRRLPHDQFTVLTTPYEGDKAFDANQSFEVVRSKQKVFLPNPWLIREVNDLAKSTSADFVMLDPALPVGAIGPKLDLPYGLILHGAEVTVPGRLPGSRQLLAKTLNGAERIIAAGGYPAAEAERAAKAKLPITIIPPGVDVDRFVPLDADQRAVARDKFTITADELVVLGLSRLVPRKGFDNLIDAAARLRFQYPNLRVLIAGSGRDRQRLEKRASKMGAPVRFLGRVSDADLPELYGAADLFAMVCKNNRWGGLEQEGFGIVFLEAAAASIPQIAGLSGGSHEAVENGETGIVIPDPDDVGALASAIAQLIDAPETSKQMGVAARKRAEETFTYDLLAQQLGEALDMEMPDV